MRPRQPSAHGHRLTSRLQHGKGMPMLRFAPRNLVVASTALAGLMSLASLPAAGPAAAQDASYCHAQYRACATRFSARTCNTRYNNCMAYSSAAPSTTIVIGGFPRFHRPKDKGDPKTPPPKTGGGGTGPKGPVIVGDIKVPKGGVNAPAGGGTGCRRWRHDHWRRQGRRRREHGRRRWEAAGAELLVSLQRWRRWVRRRPFRRSALIHGEGVESMLGGSPRRPAQRGFAQSASCRGSGRPSTDPRRAIAL